MGKIKTITKALFVGIGICFLFKVSIYYYYAILIYLIALIITCIISYFFIFKSEKLFNLFFKNFSSEVSTTEFKIKCLNITVFFSAILSLTVSMSYFLADIPIILHLPRAIIDSIVYGEWLLTKDYLAKENLSAILGLIFFSLNIYLLFGTQHFIKLLINLEKKQNVQL